MSKDNRFLYIESSQVPLTPVPYGDLKANIINPITGKPYKGVVLEGVFADLNPQPNNNRRIYDIPQYLELLKKLKQQIHSPKGVYGELEHPQGYQVNFNNVSHKLIDVWFEEESNLVKGVVLLLNTKKGKIAQEIVASGGQIAISARAAGDEITQSDGTKRAITKLLVTYDLVYHPGFSSAVLDFKELNESQQFLQQTSNSKQGFSGMLFANDLKKINESYIQYIKQKPLNESAEAVAQIKSMCFMEWYFNLNESEQDKQQELIDDNQVPKQSKHQQELKKAAEQELTESEELNQQVNNFALDCNSGLELLKARQQAQYKRKNGVSPSNTYFDNTAGFVETGLATNLSQQKTARQNRLHTKQK